MSIPETQAAKLWADLRQAFTRIDQLLPEIIETKAWEPLGYTSFTEAWTAKMDGITIATEMRPHVIYAMFNEGAQLDTIQAAIKGIGPRQLDVLKRQYNNGVPADLATTIVREHPRQKPSAPKKPSASKSEPTPWPSTRRKPKSTASPSTALPPKPSETGSTHYDCTDRNPVA